MPALSVRSWVTHFAVVAVIAVIALCVAMCGPSHPSNSSDTGKRTISAIPSTPAPSAAPPPAPPPPPVGKDYVEGLVESVSGSRIQLRTRTGTAAVDFSPSTRVVQVTPARLSDVTPGSCVNVRAASQGAPTGAAITAQSVTITAPIDGKCPPPIGFYGTVASVSGNTFTVNGTGGNGQPPATTVTVADTTSYTKQNAAGADAIVHGTCLGAQGTNGDGVLQAAMISLQACPPMGQPHHHLHLPHLPFHL
ncbi:MAG TPA: hypothetical protein VME67_10760 [Mycobacterium sp.]|nr:hypothetical protein [Mycobacterium sp.]HTX95274.1 hypothetical protein [Mycobacterium sp.]